MNEPELSPELKDLAEMEGMVMCRAIQSRASMMSRIMCREAVKLAIELMNDPDRLQTYVDKFDLE